MPNALNTIIQQVSVEKHTARLCFNGDFHWSDIAPDQFLKIQQGVSEHDATCGVYQKSKLIADTDQKIIRIY